MGYSSKPLPQLTLTHKNVLCWEWENRQLSLNGKQKHDYTRK